jgi:transcription elongation GreA/GreB family factor
MPDNPKTSRRLQRKAALAEYRAALKDFRRFDTRNETAAYRKAAERLDTAERRLNQLRRF